MSYKYRQQISDKKLDTFEPDQASHKASVKALVVGFRTL